MRLSRFFPAAFFALLCLCLFSACGTRKTAVEKGIETQTLLRGIGVELGHLDPHLGTEIGHYNVLSALLEGLVAEDPVDLRPVPGVAASWTVNGDGLEYRFQLRADARWSNGEPLTAEDFVASWRRVLSPALAAENAEQLYVIAGAEDYHRGRTSDFSQVGVRSENSTTLVVRLAHPDPAFLSRLNHVAFFPVHLSSIARQGDPQSRNTAWSKPGVFVGNGPFVLEDWRQGQEIIVRKSDTYWDKSQVKLQAIHFVFTPDRDAEERAFRAGQLHLTEALPVAKVETWRKVSPSPLRIDPYLGTEFYRLNLAQPFLKDTRVRLALNLALDRALLTEKVLRGGQQPAEMFTPPDLAGYRIENGIRHDPEKARQLLAEAGYPEGRGAPPVELLYNTSESHRALAEAIQSLWRKELGLTVKLINQERIATLAARRTGDYQILRSVWIADSPDAAGFLDLWRTGGTNNFTGWGNASYDQWLQKARAERDPVARQAALREAESLLLADPPFVVLYHYTHVFLLDPSVRGWHPTLLDHHPYKGVHLSR